MLADFLEVNRQDLIRGVESRAAEQGPEAGSPRRSRIGRLVEELIAKLRQSDRAGGADRNAAPEDRERELVELYLLEEIARGTLTTTARDIVDMGDWARASDIHTLRQGFRRLSALLDEVAERVVVLGTNGRIDYLNHAAAAFIHDLTGAPIDQLVGKTAEEVGLPPEYDVLHNYEEYLALARRRASVEKSLLGRWYEVKYRAMRSAPSGDVEALAFVQRDIHEPRLAAIRMELLSKLSMLAGGVDAEHLAESLAHVPIPELADWCVVNVVEDMRITSTSVAQSDPARAALRDAAMRAVPDWSKHPLWMEMRLTTGFQLLANVTDDLLRRIALTDEQYRLMNQAGVHSLMVQPVVSRGQIVAIITLLYTTESGRRYGQDDPPLTAEIALHAAHIVENTRLLRELRASEARFRMSLAGAKAAVFEQDASLRYRWYYGPQAPLSLVGKTDEESFPEQDAAALTSIKRHVLESGEGSNEELTVTVGGERRDLRQATEATRDSRGKVVGIIGSAIDITQEKRTQRQLRESVTFRDRMMGVLGHDLRNPLAAVNAAADAALQRDLADDVRRKVQVIQRAAGRMTEMIETLLYLTRVETFGTLPITRVPTDLSAAVRRVVDEAHFARPNRSIELEVRGDTNSVWDPARIEQAIGNLVANALQHGDPRSAVHVAVDGTAQEAVVLTVQNEGTPISIDRIPGLFEPFSRGPSDASPTGLGLGLFIVKQITVAHGGAVGVESTAEGGTVFTMRLPRQA
jgi:PAS domain S-box-containing protein